MVPVLNSSAAQQDEILKARSRLDGIAFHTWVFRSRHFDQQSDCFAFFKSENMQRSGSIHFRGIFNKLRAETQRQKLDSVYTFDDGNYGLAIALSAQIIGLKSTAILPANDHNSVADAMRAYGSRIVFYDRKSQDREDIFRELSREENDPLLLKDWTDPLIAAGEATVVLELLQEQSDLECLVVPFCDHGLFSTFQLATQAAQPGLPIYGVRFADSAIPLAGTAEFLKVDEGEMVDTMLFLLSRMKMYADPKGVAAAAAVRFRKTQFTGKKIAVLITSGNMDLTRLADYAARQVRNPSPHRPKEKYVVQCYGCSESYDAMEAVWCNCLTTERTLVCPSCFQCFCKAPNRYKDEFWVSAPQQLWDRSVEEHKHEFVPMRNSDPLEAKRPLVLIVEEEREIQRMSVRLIAGLGYGTILARDGQEGLELAGKYVPDLILTAALLPKMDGREMCRRVKADRKTSQIKVIISTASYTQSRYRVQAFRDFHADEYVNRPLSLNQLQLLLQKYLG